MELKNFKDVKLSMSKFMADVYWWLEEPRNQTVSELHYTIANSTKADTIEGLAKNKNLRNEIRPFLTGRLVQGENINPYTVPSYFMTRAVTKYITDFIC